MFLVIRFSVVFSAAMLMIILSPSLQSFPPAEAIRSTKLNAINRLSFRPAPVFKNALECRKIITGICDPELIHVAITLDVDYLRGSIAAVHSILQHSSCPENIFFHFIASINDSSSRLQTLVVSVYPTIRFKVYYFNSSTVKSFISVSIRQALEQPLNYARNYLAEMLQECVKRVIYLDSDLVVVDDITKLWNTYLGSRTIGAPEYCHANFTKYFTPKFWADPSLAETFSGRSRIPCYFNTGVMVMDLVKWRVNGYTRKIEQWMEIQRAERIYELGSLPPFLLVFAGHVAPIEHRWNQHGLGGDNVRGSCRDLHPGPVSLLHWSGSGKPWARIDERRACPLDSLWAPYDLYVHTTRR